MDSSPGFQALEILDRATGTPRATVLKSNDLAAHDHSQRASFSKTDEIQSFRRIL